MRQSNRNITKDLNRHVTSLQRAKSILAHPMEYYATVKKNVEYLYSLLFCVRRKRESGKEGGWQYRCLCLHYTTSVLVWQHNHTEGKYPR